MSLERLFDVEALASIQAAADAAETRTAGEIVPYVVRRCDDYAEAAWTGAALGALVAAGAAGLAHAWSDVWFGPLVAWITLPAFAGAAIGYLAGRFVPAVTRALTPPATLARRAHVRAAAAFLEQEVFRTEARTGILVFLALFEHRAVVLGDAGINAKVSQEAWQSVVDELVAGIRAGRPAEAMVAAISACGELLVAHGVARSVEDTDELTDEVRLRDR